MSRGIPVLPLVGVRLCACMCVGVHACACVHACARVHFSTHELLALIWLTRPDHLFAGTVMGVRLVVGQLPILFIVKKENQSAGFSGSEGKRYLLSTGGRGDIRH